MEIYIFIRYNINIEINKSKFMCAGVIRHRKGYVMKVDFFETDNGMDIRAAKGGVYQVELVKGSKHICIYVGESVWIASRCGQHLYSVMKNPEYFGLKEDDINDDKLTLKFSIYNDIEKGELGSGSYKEIELQAIKETEPLTQLKTSDRQLRNIQDKVDKVQNKMKELGFK